MSDMLQLVGSFQRQRQPEAYEMTSKANSIQDTVAVEDRYQLATYKKMSIVAAKLVNPNLH